MPESEPQPFRITLPSSLKLELTARELEAIEQQAIEDNRGNQEFLKSLIVGIAEDIEKANTEENNARWVNDLDSDKSNPMDRGQIKPTDTYPVEVELGVELMVDLAFHAIIRRYSSVSRMIEPQIPIKVIRNYERRDIEEFYRTHLDES